MVLESSTEHEAQPCSTVPDPCLSSVWRVSSSTKPKGVSLLRASFAASLSRSLEACMHAPQSGTNGSPLPQSRRPSTPSPAQLFLSTPSSLVMCSLSYPARHLSQCMSLPFPYLHASFLSFTVSNSTLLTLPHFLAAPLLADTYVEHGSKHALHIADAPSRPTNGESSGMSCTPRRTDGPRTAPPTAVKHAPQPHTAYNLSAHGSYTRRSGLRSFQS